MKMTIYLVNKQFTGMKNGKEFKYKPLDTIPINEVNTWRNKQTLINARFITLQDIDSPENKTFQ